MPNKNLMHVRNSSKAEVESKNLNEVRNPGEAWITEPLPESSRPRKDGAGNINSRGEMRDYVEHMFE